MSPFASGRKKTIPWVPTTRSLIVLWWKIDKPRRGIDETNGCLQRGKRFREKTRRMWTSALQPTNWPTTFRIFEFSDRGRVTPIILKLYVFVLREHRIFKYKATCLLQISYGRLSPNDFVIIIYNVSVSRFLFLFSFFRCVLTSL